MSADGVERELGCWVVSRAQRIDASLARLPGEQVFQAAQCFERWCRGFKVSEQRDAHRVGVLA
jgi:hypothetical protein